VNTLKANLHLKKTPEQQICRPHGDNKQRHMKATGEQQKEPDEISKKMLVPDLDLYTKYHSPVPIYRNVCLLSPFLAGDEINNTLFLVN